jgi:hypothetical protein
MTTRYEPWRPLLGVLLLCAATEARAAEEPTLEEIPYILPAAFAFTASGHPAFTPGSDGDVTLPWQAGQPRRVSLGGATAGANLDSFYARSFTSGLGAATSVAYWQFRIREPRQGRVNLTLKVKAAAQAANPPEGFISAAHYSVTVGLARTGLNLVIDPTKPDDPIHRDTTYPRWESELRKPNLVLYGQAKHYGTSTFITRQVTIDGKIESDVEPGNFVSLSEAPPISIWAGIDYVIAISASTINGGLATVDPVLVPHSSNPEIEIEVLNTVDDPMREPPLAGISPETLEAMGIDAQAFDDLGFFDLPTETQPGPSTTTTTLPSGSTTTSSTSTSSTSLVPATTTTTIPDPAGCPADDRAGLECLCARDLASACPGEILSPAIGTSFDAACSAVARGSTAGPGRRTGRRWLGRAALSFAKQQRRVGRGRARRELSEACRAALVTTLDDAEARARRLRAASTSGEP